MLPAGDVALLQIVDAAFAASKQRSGEWLVCRPGCNQCCSGVFRISALDTERLREGLRQLSHCDGDRAARVQSRVAASAARLSADFPGDPATGVLSRTEDAEWAFEGFADDEVCPVLDPASGTCDLYAFRPMTCRTFGPPVKMEGGLAVCELCFNGATPEEIKNAEMTLPPSELESALCDETGGAGESIVTFALATMQ